MRLQNTLHSNEGKNIIYIGDVGGEGTSLAIHAQNRARLLKKLGYKIRFICDGKSRMGPPISTKEGFEYCYTHKFITIPKISSVEWLFDELIGWKYLKALRQQVKTRKISLVIFYGYAGEKRLIRYCHKKNIPVLIERVDWFEKSDRMGFLEKNILQKQVDYSFTRVDQSADGIIAISEYLNEYYQSRKVNVIWIPPIFQFESYKKISRNSHTGQIHLVYAGSLGGQKDQIRPVLDVLKMINKEAVRVSMDIVGITMEQLEASTGETAWDGYGIQAMGRLANEEAKKIVEQADFSLLLRMDKRYAKAGFSTKFAESMSLGVPVICTQVGGADLVIEDMVDGVCLKDNNPETVLEKLEELLSKDSQEILQLKENAYRKARRIFNIDSYAEPMRDFIGKISSERN